MFIRIIFLSLLLAQATTAWAQIVKKNFPEPNCKIVLHKEDFSHAQMFKMLSLQRKYSKYYYKWERSNFRNKKTKRTFLKYFKEFRDISLLNYFTIRSKDTEANLEIELLLLDINEEEIKASNYLIPGYMPLSFEQLAIVPTLDMEWNNGNLLMKIKVTPIHYCQSLPFLIQSPTKTHSIPYH